MNYTMASHPTMYKRTRFRSRLEARYAALFDLLTMQWEYEPLDLEGWTPDFLVKIPCYHSECRYDTDHPYYHEILVEVKPYSRVEEFAGHKFNEYNRPYECAAIGLGLHPTISTQWEMSHGAGGGMYCFPPWRIEGHCLEDDWAEAGNVTRWRP